LSEKKESVTEKKVSRRSMLKWTGALAAAAAVGAVAGYGATELMKPPPAPPTSFKPPLSPEVQARRDAVVQDLINRHADETTTYYIFNSYTRAGRCQSPMKVHLKNGVVTALEPDDTVNPNVAREDDDWDAIMKGTIQHRSDARWYAYRKMLYDPNRLIYPMKRVEGARGDPNSKFVRISWDEALDSMASTLKQIKDKYGPYTVWDASQIFTVPGWYGMGFTGWSIFSFPGHQFSALHAAGTDGYSGSTQVTAMFDTKLLVMWGHSPNEGAGADPATRYYTILAKEKGIPIISISPRFTPMDESQSDQWIPIRTGTDGAMSIAVANVLIKEDLYDKAFVDKFVYGFDKWKDYIMGVTDGVEKTPEWAEPLTGVPAETIRDFARLYAKTKPAMLVVGDGSTRSTLTENHAWAGILLQAMTGNIGKPGTTAVIRSGQPTGFASRPLPNPSAQSGRKPSKYQIPTLIALMKWAETVFLREKLDKGEITEGEYRQTIGNAADQPLPNIRFWFPTHYAIQMQLNVKGQSEAISKIDMMATLRARADDPTSKVADIQLPFVEEMERDPNVLGFPSGFVYNAKILKPPGECRSEEWVCVNLAQRLGVVDTYFPKFNDYGNDKWDQMWEDMAKAAYESWASAEGNKDLNPPSWEDFKNKPVIRWEMDTTPYVIASDEINKGKKFPTPTGKLNAFDEDLAKPLEELKKTKYGGYVDPYPAYRPELQFGGFNDANANDYPLVCFTPQPRYRTHSWMSQNPWLKDELYEHAIVMSVPDAKVRGINDGDLVTVSCIVANAVESYIGKTRVPAAVTSRLIPGACILFKGTYWNPNAYTGLDGAGNSNAIMTDKACAAKTYANINRVQVTLV
jgi:anaerobic dimethyl sulfoxide reductase subunit A